MRRILCRRFSSTTGSEAYTHLGANNRDVVRHRALARTKMNRLALDSFKKHSLQAFDVAGLLTRGVTGTAAVQNYIEDV